MKKQWMYLLMAAGLSAGILSGCSAAGADGGSGTAKSSVAQDGSVAQDDSGAGGSASAKEADGAGKTEAGSGGTGSGQAGSGQESWDADTVTIYVPTKAGNQADLYIRFITPVLEKKLGKSFVVVNQTDGNGVVAYETVRNAQKDGSTLLYFLNSMVVQSHTGVYDKTLPENFTPLAVDTSTGSMWLTVKADSKYQSVQDIIDDVKANPGKITYGMTSGQALHMLGGMMETDMGASLAMVDAGGNAERLISLLGGNVDFTFVSTSAAEQYLETNEIKVLGCVTGTGERDPLYPDIPSVTEEGLASTMFGFDTLLLGPAGMDPELVEEINTAFQDAMMDKEVVDQFAAMKNTMEALDVEGSAADIREFDAKMAENAKLLGFE